MEDLFYGTLGTWKIYPVYLKLKQYAEPIFSRPDLVLKVHKEIFKQKVEHLVLIGFLERESNSEWEAPYFAYTKPITNQLRFLGQFRNLNNQLNLNHTQYQKSMKRC